jgi:hypothetical protein
MTMQSKAQNGADHWHAPNASGRRSGASAPSYPQSLDPQSLAGKRGEEAISAPASSQENTARTASFHPNQTAPDQNDASHFPHGSSTDSFGANFGPYDGPSHASSPDRFAAGNGAPPEEGPVSPLHVTLIALILLAGLAIGVGRSWWIDEKLDAASPKNSALTAISPDAAKEVPSSSIQSSIDRAYIPPFLNSESDAQEQDQHARLAIAPEPVTEPEQPSTAMPPQTESAPLPEPEQAEPPKDLSTMRDEAPGTKPAAALPEKKRKSSKTSSSAKLESANRKERLREIDRVRAQAFSETSKDRIGGKKSSSSESPVGPQSERRNSFRTSKVAQHTVTRSQYARCERIDHIIRREKCKWDLCNNQWGKGACPSFKHEKAFLF